MTSRPRRFLHLLRVSLLLLLLYKVLVLVPFLSLHLNLFLVGATLFQKAASRQIGSG